MGADDGALAALDTDVRIPLGNERGDVALLPLRGGCRPGAVVRNRRNGKIVTLLGDHLRGDVLDELGRFVGDRRRLLELARGSGGILDLLDGGAGRLDALPVHLDDVLTLLGIGLLGVVLEDLDRIELGAVGRGELDAGELEERSLEDGVRARAHAVLERDLGGVDHVELKFLVDDDLLDLVRHVVPDLGGRVGRGEEEHGARLCGLEHVVLLEVRKAVASREVRRVDEVRAADHVAAETEVGDRHAAGLLGVVLEVALREVLGVVADDLDGVLVRADRTIRAETPEHALLAVARGHHEGHVAENALAADVVDDAAAEVVLRLVGEHVVVDRLADLRGEVLGAETVAAREHLGILEGDDPLLQTLTDRRRDVEVERIVGAGLLRAVENGDALDRGGDRLDEVLHGERTVEMHLEETDLLAFLDEGVDRLVERVAAGTHSDDDILGISGADVVVELVRAARELLEHIHVLLDDRRSGLVVLVAGLTALEVNVGVLGGTAHRGMLRIEGAAAEIGDVVVVDHLADHVVADLIDLLHFVGGAEAVEEVEERNLRLERCGVGDHRHIVGFLHRVGAEHRKTGLAAGHHVGVVAENAETLTCEGARGDVEHGRRKLARDLVHVGDHQEETLRRREGRRKRTRRERAMDRTGRAALGLHLNHARNRAPYVLLCVSSELIAGFRHR